jgi:anti-sigma regulatory factor (Ser/Thr protein kinase)
VTWTRYEAILNKAFERSHLWAVCPYDTRTLPHRVVQDAYRTHPTVWKAGRRTPSPGFVDPATLLRELPESIKIPVGEPNLRLPITGGSPDRWRHPVAAVVADSGLPADRVHEFLIAITEVAANALRYGGDQARLALWVTNDGIVCEVRDDGPGLDDPFAGYIPPTGDDDTPRGSGLWIARQLCDTLAIELGPRGTTVRLMVGR